MKRYCHPRSVILTLYFTSFEWLKWFGLLPFLYRHLFLLFSGCTPMCFSFSLDVPTLISAVIWMYPHLFQLLSGCTPICSSYSLQCKLNVPPPNIARCTGTWVRWSLGLISFFVRQKHNFWMKEANSDKMYILTYVCIIKTYIHATGTRSQCRPFI